jgi:predicted TIM-barrel fold metal-dependent hydrolase
MSGALPRGACDCHCHVFGPAARFPYAEPRSYTPAGAPLAAYLAMLDRLGFDRGVLVQPSAYGRDNRAMLDALTREPQRLRGVAVGGAELTAATLRQWHAAGVRGLRANEFRRDGKPYYQNGVTLKEIEPLLPLLADLGWHLQLWIDARDGGSARAGAGAGGGRSHGPPGAPSRHP